MRVRHSSRFSRSGPTNRRQRSTPLYAAGGRIFILNTLDPVSELRPFFDWKYRESDGTPQRDCAIEVVDVEQSIVSEKLRAKRLWGILRIAVLKTAALKRKLGKIVFAEK